MKIRKTRKIRIISLILTLFLLINTASLSVFAEPETTAPTTAPITTPDTGEKEDKDEKDETLDTLCDKASAVSLYCPESDMMLFEKEGDKTLRPYAVARMCALLVAYERITDWDTPITLDSSMIVTFTDGWGFKVGDTVSPYDLAVLALLRGFDDATVVLCRAVCGDDDTTVRLMNEKAAKLGATSTKFDAVSGRGSAGRTTAKDAALIAAAFAKCDKLFSIAGEDMIKCESLGGRKIYSRSYFLSGYYNATGKSYLDSSVTASIAGSLVDPDMLINFKTIGEYTYIAVVMDAKSATGRSIPCDITNLLIKTYKNSFSLVKVLGEYEPICEIPVRMGEGIDAVAATPDRSFSFYIKNADSVDEIFSYKYTLDNDMLDAPVSAGAKVGELVLLKEGKEVGRADLITRVNVSKSMKEYYYDRAKAVITDKFVLRAIMIAAAVLAVAVFSTALVRGQKKKRKNREEDE